MKNQIQTVSEVKNRSRTSTSAHETSKNKQWLSMLVIALLALSAALVSCGEEETFIVAFDSKGGSFVSVQTVERGGKIVEPKDPTRDGYNFTGWATADDETSLFWDFEKGIVEAAMILYAKWSDGGGNSNGVVKLPKYIISNNHYEKLEYDDQNRIKKISNNMNMDYLFTYSGDDLVRIGVKHNDHYVDFEPQIFEFVKTGNKITFTSEGINGSIDLDNDGYPTKIEQLPLVITFQIQKGNVMKTTKKYTWNGEEGTEVRNFKYDNKKSPFYHCKTPQWYFCMDELDFAFSIYSSLSSFGSHNNITERTYPVSDGISVYDATIEYIYQFDSEGYPVSCIELSGMVGAYKIEYIYE